MNHKIDLHGFTHDQACKKVENELVKISTSNFWEVVIVTGKSKAMQDRIISEVLEPLNFFYYQPSSNPGVIVVVQDELFN
jgi:hypothetical protein